MLVTGAARDTVTELILASCGFLSLTGFLTSLSEEVAESASADSVKSFMLVTRLRSECFDSVSGLAYAIRLLIIDSVFRECPS